MNIKQSVFLYLFVTAIIISSCTTKEKYNFYIPSQFPQHHEEEFFIAQKDIKYYKPKSYRKSSKVQPTPQKKRKFYLPRAYQDSEANNGDFVDVGVASWYGPNFHGKKTANGEIYNQYDMTVAHKFLPLNTLLRVTNLENNKSVIVRVNDRGPYAKNRILDASRKVATELDFLNQGTAKIRINVVKYPVDYDRAKGLLPYQQTVIQIAAFNRKSHAIQMTGKLQRKYNKLPIFLDNHRKKYFVLAGPYDDKKIAGNVALSLRNDGLSALARSYRK